MLRLSAPRVASFGTADQATQHVPLANLKVIRIFLAQYVGSIDCKQEYSTLAASW